MNFGQAKERRIANVYVFTAPRSRGDAPENDSAPVVVLDENGSPMPELQGIKTEVFPKIAERGFDLGRVVYGSFLEQLLREWGRI
jgi:hypothetical protein